ncbi:DUF6141 family protein [Pedobacter endophyticus]|uniref:DUF6141 family protein n=1 Tax=Pedobacter endophyticus TaxID=2789740 RepID=UPI001E542478|nr:DUF6141 family protein [Pedobacter endophyticus]
MNQKILFSEIQGDGNVGLIILLILIDILMLYLLFTKWKAKSMLYNIGIGLGLIIAFLATFIIITMKQYTEIKEDGVYVELFPIQPSFNFYPWEGIEKCYVRTYNPISEYGGWGLKGSAKNKAVNESGNIGLQLRS